MEKLKWTKEIFGSKLEIKRNEELIGKIQWENMISSKAQAMIFGILFTRLLTRIYNRDNSANKEKDQKLFRNDVVINSVKSINKIIMKTLNFFAMLLIAAMLINSCKKEEDPGTPRQTTNTYTFSLNLRGTADVKGELPATVLNLTDVIGTEPAKNFKNAEMQLANSYLEISGLSQVESPDTVAVILKDFTIKVGTRQGVNLGDCSTDPQAVNEFAADIKQSTNQMISIIQNIFTDITSGGKASSVSVSFTPNVSITAEDNVQLKIFIGGTYHYVVFE